MDSQIAEQTHFRPPLPSILGCQDYREQRQLLVRIDDLMEQAGTDRRFVELSLRQYDRWREDPNQFAESGWEPPYCPYTALGTVKQSWLNHTRSALRVNIVRYLTNASLRCMSVDLADRALIRWFCYVNEFGPINPPSKSTVDRYEDWIDTESIRVLGNEIIQQAAGIGDQSQDQVNPLGLAEAIDLEDIWTDGTCLKVNIHYPIDWVLLRDCTRTLMKATVLIRRRGLKNRMPQEPPAFLRDINKRVIEMTQARRKKGAKKERKRVLRLMIKLQKRIAHHARLHRDILEDRWSETDLSEAQAQQIIRRIDGVLKQLPAAIHQARERIIGERQVPPKDKILSIYEPESNVIVRGKADAEVEFGNILRISEQKDGVIVDWELYREVVADNEPRAFAEGVERLKEVSAATIKNLWTDRGMDSAANVKKLEDSGIANGIFPKSLDLLNEKMSAPDYAAGQKRRASTEGRIGIFKNNILGKTLHNKGFASRRRAVGWGAVAHNLWVLARLPEADQTLVQSVENQQRARAA
jgi:hypothetical protein